jgi:hypothetical protein
MPVAVIVTQSLVSSVTHVSRSSEYQSVIGSLASMLQSRPHVRVTLYLGLNLFIAAKAKSPYPKSL